MLFLDDESQHKYNSRANTTLQVICQFLENYLTECNFQLLLIDAEEAIAVCGVDSGSLFLRKEVAQDIANKLNAQFKQKNGRQTCVLQNDQDIIFVIHCGDSSELAQLH